MDRLLDANLWIDFTRRRSPRPLKDFIAPFMDDPSACLAEPVIFEVLRSATDGEMKQLVPYFTTFPVLESPDDLWVAGAQLGRACRRVGFHPASIDLLIAIIAISHDAELLTFDADFVRIAGVSGLQVNLLKRPRV